MLGIRGELALIVCPHCIHLIYFVFAKTIEPSPIKRRLNPKIIMTVRAATVALAPAITVTRGRAAGITRPAAVAIRLIGSEGADKQF
jgi:hypothetical protein